MKIAFIDVTATVSYGGVQTAVWQLALALADRGHDLSVFGGEGTLRPDLRGRSVTVRTFSFTPRNKVLDLGSRFQRTVERWTFARHARSSVAAGAFDWVILTKPFDFFWPRLVPSGSSTRFAFVSGGTDFYRGDRILARGIDAWMACSHFNAWQIQNRYKRFPAVIYNGVNVDRFAPAAADPALRTALGYEAADVVFVYAGRLVGWKGLRYAIEALANPVLERAPVKLLVIGAGETRAELAAQAAGLGVAHRVRFHDPLAHDELPRYYAAFDAGVFPSIGDEAFGITIAEAMACGKPVIASHVGGIPEVVGNEGTAGILVAPGASGEIAAAMAALAARPELRERLGAAARARIASNFTWERAAQRLLDCLS